MRFSILSLILLLAVALLAACSSGPGADCDDCAKAEATAVGPSSQAAAATASGGMRAENAPKVTDTVSPRTKVTVGRGAGDTTSTSSDLEHRSVASGGAMTLGLKADAEAQASTGGGGVGVGVQEAQKTVAGWRSALMLAMTEQHVDMAKVEFIKTSLVQAQADLNAAEAAASANRPNVTHNYGGYMTGDNTLVGYSRSGNGEGPDSPEATKILDDASRNVLSKKPAAPKADAPEPSGTEAVK